MRKSVYKKSVDLYSHKDHIDKVIYRDYVYNDNDENINDNDENIHKDYVNNSPEENIEKYEYYKTISKNHEKDVNIRVNNINENLTNNKNIEICDDKNDKDCIQINWGMLKTINKSDPTIWGPTLWFSLHNGAAKYPTSASKLTKERMKGYIEGIPYILPCKECQIHASDYISNNKDNLELICSTRDNLFNFFVDFHNEVNKRKNKKTITYEDAKKIYLH